MPKTPSGIREYAEEVETEGLILAPNGANLCCSTEARNNRGSHVAREKYDDYLQDSVIRARNEAVSPYFATQEVN